MRLTVSEKLYIVIREDDPERRLAFIVNYAEDAAFEKRKQTAVSWGKGRYSENLSFSEQIIDNDFVSGFVVDTTQSRWYSGNQVFEVRDPRGFSAQIQAFNMCDIIKTDVIDHGLIAGSYKWAREGNSLRLVKESDEEYQKHLIEIEGGKVEKRPGDVIEDYRGAQYTYVGQAWRYHLPYHSSSKYIYQGVVKPYYEYSYHFQDPRRDTKPVHLLLERLYGGTYALRTKAKFTEKDIVVGHVDEYEDPYGKWREMAPATSSYNNMSYGIPFRTKEEVMSFDPDLEAEINRFREAHKLG